jgi:hypothetical protein
MGYEFSDGHPKMPFAERHDPSQTLGPDGRDESLGVRISDSHAGDTTPERVTIDGISASHDPSRCGVVVRKGFDDVLRRPVC